MNKLWKFLFLFTWIVIIVIMVFLAFALADKSSQSQQQIINQYVTKNSGLSAYQVAVKNGFEGTEQEWLSSLHGKDSRSTHTVVQKETEVKTEEKTTVVEQVPVEGKSSYDVWLSVGNVGTQTDYLNSLKGEPGQTTDYLLRFNADLGLFQSKKSTDTFWKTVPTCGGTTGRVCN